MRRFMILSDAYHVVGLGCVAEPYVEELLVRQLG